MDIPTIAALHACGVTCTNFPRQRRDIRSPQEIALKQCRVVPVFRSVVVLGLVSAGLTSAAVAQSPQVEESASSSNSLGGALLAPVEPDAPTSGSTVATQPVSLPAAPSAVRSR